MKGQLLYQKAKTLIPGGIQLLSKRPELFLPEQWPTYYQSAKGIEITDLDGQTYLDMSIMSVGAFKVHIDPRSTDSHPTNVSSC